ncbi:Protein phosphatase [Globisporangium polare]
MDQQQGAAPKKHREGLFRHFTKRFHIHRHDDTQGGATAARSPAAQPAAVSRRHTLTDAIPSTATSTTLLPAPVTLKQPTPVKHQKPQQPLPVTTAAAAASSTTSSSISNAAQPLRRHSSAPIATDLAAEVLPPTSMLSTTGSGHQLLQKSASARLNVIDERRAASLEEVFDESEYNEDDEDFDVDDVENEENQDANSSAKSLSRSGSGSSSKKKNPISITFGLSTAEGLMGHDNEDRLIVEQNENFHLIAVLDGHGGGMVADFVKEKLFPAIERCYDHGFNLKELSDTIDYLDQQAQDKAQQRLDYSGACMVCVLLYVDEATGQPQTLTLNVGDCRAIMHESRGKGKNDNKGSGPNGKLYALSEDHCEANTKEKLRVLASGAYIEYGRIGGVLEPFRSIGDIDMKEREMDGWVIATPEIKKTRLLLGRSTLILATDGVWGSLVNQKVMAIARKFPNDLQAAADAIVTAAREAGSLDDIAVVVAKV